MVKKELSQKERQAYVDGMEDGVRLCTLFMERKLQDIIAIIKGELELTEKIKEDTEVTS